MKKMMKIAAMVACVGAMFCIAGCGNGNSPESVALESMQGFIKMMGADAESYAVKVAKSEINGEKGVVFVDIYDDGKKKHTEKVKVFREGGVWKVGLSKEDKELEEAARIARDAALFESERFEIRKPEYGYIQGGAKVIAKEKKGENIFVTVELLADEKKYASIVVEMKKTGDTWKPVYKK